MRALVPTEVIEQKILLIQGEKVILDKDLADLYGVTTSNLNKAVNRNIERFPKDFMIQLSAEEFRNLKFHFGTSSWNIKLGWNPKTATSIHRTRRGYAIECSEKQVGDRSEHYDRESFRETQEHDLHA